MGVEMSKTAIYLLLLTVALTCSCSTQSVIYSPAVNLTPEPLEQGQLQLMAGYGELPEARPHRMPEETAAAVEGTIRAGIMDWMAFQLKGWWDVSDNAGVNRSGYSLAIPLTIVRNYNGFDFGILPTGVMLYDESDCLGGGGTVSACVWFPEVRGVHGYWAFGWGYGVHDAYNVDDKWGWLVSGNLGAAVLLFDHLTINAEISAVRQYNNYDDRSDIFIVPSIAVGGLSDMLRCPECP